MRKVGICLVLLPLVRGLLQKSMESRSQGDFNSYTIAINCYPLCELNANKLPVKPLALHLYHKPRLNLDEMITLENALVLDFFFSTFP
jgi:hypothetical protein